MKRRTNLSLLTLLIFLLHPLAAIADKIERIEFEVLDTGNFSGIDHQMIMVAETEMRFKHLWQMHKMDKEAELPDVDFEQEIVVAHFLGNSASCGFDIEVIKVKEKDETVQVKSILTVPEEPIYCLVAEQPFEIIKMPRQEKFISFKQKIDSE